MPSSHALDHEQPLLTAEEYARLPDEGHRTELVRGRVVREPQPTYLHGSLQARVVERLVRHIRENGLPLGCVGPSGFVVERGPDTVRGPDVAVVRTDRLPSPDHAGFVEGGPDLAVEIVSPSDSAADIQQKVQEYLRSGTRLVWVIYPGTRTVAVHETLSHARFLSDDDELDGGDVVPGLQLRLRELFEG